MQANTKNCCILLELSDGTENLPIFIERDPINADLPTFQYTPENVPGPDCDIDPSEVTLPGCGCRSPSCQQGSCLCFEHHGQAYDAAGLLQDQDREGDECQPVFECNALCLCGETCSNRVVQGGLRLRLRVFPTGSRGWGVRTLDPVPRRSFVCEYAGEVIGREEACRRLRAQGPGDMNYVIAVREHAGRDGLVAAQTFVDPAMAGNVGRFLNHSCQPNLFMVPVRVHSLVPRLALFAGRDIAPHEELTFDYSGDYNGNMLAPVPSGSNSQSLSSPSVMDTLKRNPCHCGALGCRGFLPLDLSLMDTSQSVGCGPCV